MTNYRPVDMCREVLFKSVSTFFPFVLFPGISLPNGMTSLALIYRESVAENGFISLD
jgi:hypothetical protein